MPQRSVKESLCVIDAEHALDPIYARKLGVDINNLLFPSRTPAAGAGKCDALARSAQ
ncbi:hypothetical protein ACNKHP_07630 [Shigella boydii]